MPAIGDLLADRYRIETRLGAGGMGTVWRAHDLRLDRDVAVKVLLPSYAGDPVLTERFDREARALAAVASPYVIAIHDVVTSPGSDPFLVMELCPDGSLGDRLDAAGSLAVAVALPLLADAAEGLAALHARGILHRDVTPRNVLLSGERAKLGDLGLARAGAAGDRPHSTEVTAPGTTVGTLAYLAPELLEGTPPSTASDVYGLGAVAYRTLAGVLPHAAGNVAELVTARLRPVEPLGDRLPGVAPALASLIARTLDARPEARPSAVELASGLRNLAVAAAGSGHAGTGPAETGATGAPRAGEPTGSVAAGYRAAATGPDAPTRAAIETEAAQGAGAAGAGASPAGAAGAGASGAGAASRPAAPIPRRPGPASDRYRGPSLWTGEILLVAIVAAIVLLVLLAIAGAFDGGRAVNSGPSGSPANSFSAPSPSPSASSPSPAPAADPFEAAAARTADLRAVIDAAKGPGALKGKEAKDLGNLLDEVARAIADGDAAAAIASTDRLAAQVRALVSGGVVGGEQARALEAGVGDLLAAVAALP